MGRNGKKRGRNGNGVRPFWEAGYAGGSGRLFQDTIIVQNSTADPSADINLSTGQLIPSMGVGRKVLPHRIRVEIMPTLWNGGVSANSDALQFQLSAIDTTVSSAGLKFPVMPFKMCSNINPTSGVVNYTALKKVCPTVVRIFDSDGSESLFGIRFKPFDLTEPRVFQMRITSEFWILPQLDPEVLTNPN